jgi:hypothetical protein
VPVLEPGRRRRRPRSAAMRLWLVAAVLAAAIAAGLALRVVL